MKKNQFVFITSHSPYQTNQASVLKIYSEAKKSDLVDVKIICLGLSIARLLYSRKNFNLFFKHLMNFDLHLFSIYEPLPINGIFSKPLEMLNIIWSWKFIFILLITVKKNGILFFEAGSSSFIIEKILSKSYLRERWNIIYRINDLPGSFRIFESYSKKNDKIISYKLDNLIISSPSKIPYEKCNKIVIPPGVNNNSLINSKVKKQNIIIYPGMYPISAEDLKIIEKQYLNYRIFYTGPYACKSNRIFNLGIINPKDLEHYFKIAKAGIMIFPNKNYEWFLNSNKMIMFKALGIPILANNSFELDLTKYNIHSIYGKKIDFIKSKKNPIKPYTWENVFNEHLKVFLPEVRKIII